LLSAELGYEQAPHILVAVQNETLFIASGPSYNSVYQIGDRVGWCSRTSSSARIGALELYVSTGNVGVLFQTPRKQAILAFSNVKQTRSNGHFAETDTVSSKR